WSSTRTSRKFGCDAPWAPEPEAGTTSAAAATATSAAAAAAAASRRRATRTRWVRPCPSSFGARRGAGTGRGASWRKRGGRARGGGRGLVGLGVELRAVVIQVVELLLPVGILGVHPVRGPDRRVVGGLRVDLRQHPAIGGPRTRAAEQRAQAAAVEHAAVGRA